MKARIARRTRSSLPSAALGLLIWSCPWTAAAQGGAASAPSTSASSPSLAVPRASALQPTPAEKPAPAAQPVPAPTSGPAPTASQADSARDAAAQATENFDLEGAVVSPDHGLTSDDAGRRARERAPAIALAQASATSSRWDAQVQKSSFYPQVQLSAQYKRITRIENTTFDIPMEFLPPGSKPLDFTQPQDNYLLVASARWPVSDLFLRVYPAYKASRGVADARAIEVEARANTAELAAREAFYAHARALAAYAVAQQAVKQADAQALQAKLFVEAGTAAPVDFMTATARVESMRAAVARSAGAVAVTRNTLATLMGVSTGDVTGIREPVMDLPTAPTDSVDVLLQRGLEQRAELRAMRKVIGANELLKMAERNSTLPTLSVEGNNLYGNPNPRYIPPVKEFHNSWEVGATLAWSPNNSLVGYQRTQRAAAEVEKARSDLLALEDAVRIEVVQSYEDYKAADAAARASEEQRRAAEETYRVRLATYRVGAGVQIDLLNADLALSQARLDRANSVLDARLSLARLARATGGPIR